MKFVGFIIPFYTLPQSHSSPHDFFVCAKCALLDKLFSIPKLKAKYPFTSNGCKKVRITINYMEICNLYEEIKNTFNVK